MLSRFIGIEMLAASRSLTLKQVAARAEEGLGDLKRWMTLGSTE